MLPCSGNLSRRRGQHSSVPRCALTASCLSQKKGPPSPKALPPAVFDKAAIIKANSVCMRPELGRVPPVIVGWSTRDRSGLPGPSMILLHSRKSAIGERDWHVSVVPQPGISCTGRFRSVITEALPVSGAASSPPIGCRSARAFRSRRRS